MGSRHIHHDGPPLRYSRRCSPDLPLDDLQHPPRHFRRPRGFLAHSLHILPFSVTTPLPNATLRPHLVHLLVHDRHSAPHCSAIASAIPLSVRLRSFHLSGPGDA